ncbi:MAG TPA: hypothetical protein VGO31_11065, partial [Microbacteriaceae bacterium]|nr:hypothetical protein [Microbacteriaceae bacterium]
MDADWYPELDPEELVVCGGPAVADGQLELGINAPLWPLSAECIPEFGPFRDAGDRALIHDAFRAGIPVILTTDLKSFWRHRRALAPFQIEVPRPSDLWAPSCADM